VLVGLKAAKDGARQYGRQCVSGKCLCQSRFGRETIFQQFTVWMRTSLVT